MKAIISIILLLLIIGCSGERTDLPTAPLPQPSVSVIIGMVEFWQGDFMPVVAPNLPSGTIEPVSRTIYIHEATTNDDVLVAGDGGFFSEINTPLVSTVVSNAAGQFTVTLPPGTYSLFVAENGLYYANVWSDSYIQPVTIEAGQTARIVIQINYLATY